MTKVGRGPGPGMCPLPTLSEERQHALETKLLGRPHGPGRVGDRGFLPAADRSGQRTVAAPQHLTPITAGGQEQVENESHASAIPD
jgi:hypothetical protein